MLKLCFDAITMGVIIVAFSAIRLSVAYADDTASIFVDKDFYSKSDAMKCGGKTISIVSSCMENSQSGGDPFCFSQELNFIDKNEHKATSVLYKHAMKEYGQDFIAKITCNAEKKQLVVMSTNFGNCGTCEWVDLYSLFGKYQGTIGDRGRDLPSVYKAFGSTGDPLSAKPSRLPAMEIDRNR